MQLLPILTDDNANTDTKNHVLIVIPNVLNKFHSAAWIYVASDQVPIAYALQKAGIMCMWAYAGLMPLHTQVYDVLCGLYAPKCVG